MYPMLVRVFVVFWLFFVISRAGGRIQFDLFSAAVRLMFDSERAWIGFR